MFALQTCSPSLTPALLSASGRLVTNATKRLVSLWLPGGGREGTASGGSRWAERHEKGEIRLCPPPVAFLPGLHWLSPSAAALRVAESAPLRHSGGTHDPSLLSAWAWGVQAFCVLPASAAALSPLLPCSVTSPPPHCGHLQMDSLFLHVLTSSYALWYIYQLARLLGRLGANSSPSSPAQLCPPKTSADIANHPLGGRLSLGGEPLLSTHTL